MRISLIERGTLLTPEFDDALDRIEDDAVGWLLRFAQSPLPKEQTRKWTHLRYELMSMICLHLDSLEMIVERKGWIGTLTLVDFVRKKGRWSQIPLPPSKDVKEIQETLRTWLHQLMHDGAVVMKFTDISEISIKIKKHKNASRKSWGQRTHIEIKGGYKETFLLAAAQLLEAEFQWFRLCAFKACPHPVFVANDNRQKYCSAKHQSCASSKEYDDGESVAKIHRAQANLVGSHTWQVIQAHASLPFGQALPPKRKPHSKKKVLPKKKARK